MRLSVAAALVAALAVAACGSVPKPDPQVRTVRVEVPTPVPCINDRLGDPPAYPDTDAALRAAAGPGERYTLMSAGRGLRMQRLAELEAVVGACRVLAPGP